MAIVPNKLLDRVAFYAAHISPWQVNAEMIGLDPIKVTDLGTLVSQAQAAAAARDAALGQAKAATEALRIAVEAMSVKGAAMIGMIRNTAQDTGNASIYVLAEIPAPRTPSPAPAPGTPHTPAVALRQDGALTLSWRCKNAAGASGTMYNVQRSVDGQAWQPLASTGKKLVLDASIPAGAVTVSYQVTAARSTGAGSPAQFNVRFGGGAGAGMAVQTVQPEPIASPASGTTMRKAA